MMRAMVMAIGVVAAALVSASSAAAKDRFDVGEGVASFTLTAVNPDQAGKPDVVLDTFFGAGAREPKKAILLSFFATYCEPCKREMPFLSALYDAYKDKGLMVLSVSIDTEPYKIEFAKTLAAQSKARFPVLTDRFNIVAKRYFVSKLPCVYLINGEGKVALVNIGYNEDTSKVMLEEVRRLLGEPASEPVPEALAKYAAGRGAATIPATLPLAAVGQALPALPHNQTLLMLELRPIAAVSPRVCQIVSRLILASLSKVEGLRTLSSEDIDAMLNVEKKKDALGCDSTTCFAEIGGALGAELVLYGDIGQLGSNFSVSLNVVDTKSATVRARVSRLLQASEDALAAAAPNIVYELVMQLSK